MWGDVGRCGEVWGDVGRCGSCAVIAGTSNEWSSGQTNGRDISTWGDMGRHGEIKVMIHHRIGNAVVAEGYFRRNDVSRTTAPPTPPWSR